MQPRTISGKKFIQWVLIYPTVYPLLIVAFVNSWLFSTSMLCNLIYLLLLGYWAKSRKIPVINMVPFFWLGWMLLVSVDFLQGLDSMDLMKTFTLGALIFTLFAVGYGFASRRLLATLISLALVAPCIFGSIELRSLLSKKLEVPIEEPNSR